MADASRITSQPFVNQLPPGAPPAVRTNPPPGTVLPKESFTASQAAPDAPVSASRAEATPGQKRAGKKGLYFALGVGATLAVVGGAALINDTPPPPPVQSQPMTHAEKDALDNLDYLQQLAQKDGGGLKVDGLIFGQKEATPAEAFQRLHEGEPVYFYESEAEAPVAIGSFEQLDDVRADVQERAIRSKIRSGVESLKRDAQEGIDEIRDSAREAWEEVFGNVRR